jgi:hypothetical protein
MKVIITTARYVILSALSKHGGWMDAEALNAACGYEDPTAVYSSVQGLRQIGLVDTMKRRVDNRLSRVKLLVHWRISEAGSQLLDEYEAGKHPYASAPKLVAEPEPEPETEPDYVPATIRELEDEVLRLRALVEKYVPVVVNIPNIGEVRLSREEAHSLLQQLLAASGRE